MSHLWCYIVCRADDVGEDLSRLVEDGEPKVCGFQGCLIAFVG